MLDQHVEKIIDMFDSQENIDHLARSVPYEKIVDHDYNLSVSSYVEPGDTREVIDIVKLNAELEALVKRNNDLRLAWDKHVKKLERRLTSGFKKKEGKKYD